MVSASLVASGVGAPIGAASVTALSMLNFAIAGTQLANQVVDYRNDSKLIKNTASTASVSDAKDMKKPTMEILNAEDRQEKTLPTSINGAIGLSVRVTRAVIVNKVGKAPKTPAPKSEP